MNVVEAFFCHLLKRLCIVDTGSIQMKHVRYSKQM